ncbi:MAG: hypothetical protein ACTHP8_13890 [Bosea sp. (in: a-proteobacteria)]|uniref:hypothetical protein n=1 Tax=Bosea sp. (in: a-proteobacteria) TaxID=1871050 RepID=UPI003F7B3FB7
MLFLPTRPYFLVSALRIARASPAEMPSDACEQYANPFRSVGLERLVQDPGRERDWDRQRSLEEQQILGFARIFLHKSRQVVVNEPLGAVPRGIAPSR